MTAMTTDLHSVLTPALFREMADASIPFSSTEPIDFSEVIASFFGDISGEEDMWAVLEPRVWSALQALSKLGVDKADDFDFQEYLPPAEDDSFPHHALGFILLLDQGPRRLCRGVDNRYIDGYFAIYALRLFRYLHEDLAPELRITSWQRWEKLGVSFDYFIVARDALNAVLAHNESTAEYCLGFTDEARCIVEKHCGVRDPHRDGVELQEKRWGLYAFPELIASVQAGGLPKGPMGVAEGSFWMERLIDVHYPVLERFGRYPYCNDALGRESTAEEDEWINKAKVFQRMPAGMREHIKNDVDNGVWSPLGDKDGKPRG